jgi:CHASE3 domain sensor protein
MTFKNKISAGFGTALAILVLVGVLSYRSMVQSDEDRRWVTHTHQVLEQVDTVVTDLLGAETGERGFILTGETSFLDPYNDAFAHVNGDMTELRRLTSDNPVQQRTLDRVEPLISERLSMLHDRVELRKQEGLVSGAEIVRQGPGKRHMDMIRTQLAGMKEEENR